MSLLFAGLVLPALAAPVRFVAMGDAPYVEADIPRVETLIASFEGQGLSFAVHVGDVKFGGDPCTDAVFLARRDALTRSVIPLVFTPGDNEWTDCHRSQIEGKDVDPLERLGRLREIFYRAPLGAGGLDVVAQSRHGGRSYPENQRWVVGGVVFATFHLVGSADGRGRTPEGDVEAIARREADLAWLASAVLTAKQSNAPALVLFQQADTGDPADGFADWNAALVSAAKDFARPLLLVHGDSHKPMFDASFLGAANLWRVIVPGAPLVGATVIAVDASQPTPFAVSELKAAP